MHRKDPFRNEQSSRSNKTPNAARDIHFTHLFILASQANRNTYNQPVEDMYENRSGCEKRKLSATTQRKRMSEQRQRSKEGVEMGPLTDVERSIVKVEWLAMGSSKMDKTVESYAKDRPLDRWCLDSLLYSTPNA